MIATPVAYSLFDDLSQLFWRAVGGKAVAPAAAHAPPGLAPHGDFVHAGQRAADAVLDDAA